jgi:hypothetical protein
LYSRERELEGTRLWRLLEHGFDQIVWDWNHDGRANIPRKILAKATQQKELSFGRHVESRREELAQAPFRQKVGKEGRQPHPCTVNGVQVIFEDLTKDRPPWEVSVRRGCPELRDVVGQ